MNRKVIRNILAEDCSSPCPEVACDQKLVFESTEQDIPFQETIQIVVSGKMVVDRYKKGSTGESTGAKTISVQLESDKVQAAIASAIIKAVNEGIGGVSGAEGAVREQQYLMVPAMLCNDEYLELDKQGD